MKYDNDGYPDRVAEPTRTISLAKYEALMAAAKALEHVYRDDGCGEESNAEMRAALTSLRAAGIEDKS